MYSTQQQASPDLRYWSVCLSAKHKAKSDDSDPCIADPRTVIKTGRFQSLYARWFSSDAYKTEGPSGASPKVPLCTSTKDRDGPLETISTNGPIAPICSLTLNGAPIRAADRACCPIVFGRIAQSASSTGHHSDPDTVHCPLIVLTH